MKEDIDNKLYNDYLNGNKEAFDILYRKYKNKIKYFIFNIVKDYQKAEDLTQEVFIYVLQNNFKENGRFKYYLYLIAKSRAISYVNVENRRNQINEQYLYNKNDEIEDDVLEVITKEESKKEVIEAINKLDDKYKNALYLVKIEELSYKETARILGESLQNVKNIVHRGKKELRKLLINKEYNELNKISKTFIIIICIIIISSGITYAGTIIYNYVIQKTSKEENVLDINDYFEINEEELYFKKIVSYKEYLEYKETWNTIIDMSESEFKDNFLIVIAGSWRNPGINISNVFCDDSTLYIEVDKKVTVDEIQKEEYMVSAKISKELDRENVLVKNKVKNITSNKYSKLENLPIDYSMEQAEIDGCITIYENRISENNIEKLDAFISNTKNGNEDYIRIVRLEDDNIKNAEMENKVIYDICFTNGEYILYIDSTRAFLPGNKSIDYIGSFQYIEKVKEENVLNGLTRIYLKDLLGSNVLVALFE